MPRVTTLEPYQQLIFAKVLKVSIQIIGNKNKLITGIKSNKIQYFGRLMICINTIPLYTGTYASQAFLPAFLRIISKSQFHELFELIK